MFPAEEETVFSERRVYQIEIVPLDGRYSVFFAVDALIAETFKTAVAGGDSRPPDVLVCANNSQEVPTGAFGAQGNLLPIPVADAERLNGLALLYELLVRYPQGLHSLRHIVISGNGFINANQPYGPFLLSDHPSLAECANQLSLPYRVHGPLPGWLLDLDCSPGRVGQLTWVKVDTQLHAELRERQARFIAHPTSPRFVPVCGAFRNCAAAEEALDRIEAELPALAHAMLLSPVGSLASATHVYLEGPLGPRRILLRLLHGPGGRTVQYALDLAEGAFVPDNTPAAAVLRLFPFGLEAHLIDFDAVLTGDLQIWDLAGTAIRSWYLGDKYRNLVSFLYGYFGEQTRPDLAWKVYERAVNNLACSNGEACRPAV
jgi:hypothetical protein